MAVLDSKLSTNVHQYKLSISYPSWNPGSNMGLYGSVRCRVLVAGHGVFLRPYDPCSALYSPQSDLAPSILVGPSASITPVSTSPSPTSTVGPTTVFVSVTPTPSETQRSASSTPVGAIVGGVVGGVALLVAIAVGIWFCCLRKQRQPQQIQEDMRPSNVGAMYNGAFPGQMSPTTPGSQGTTALLQPPQSHYPFYS